MLIKGTQNRGFLRRIECLILSICMLLGLSAGFTYASDMNTTNITVGTVSAKSGDTVQVPITISAPGGIAGYQFSIKYDPSKIIAVNIDNGITVPIINLKNSKEGEVKFSFASANALEAAGKLFTINFKVLDTSSASSVDIKLVNEVFNDIEGKTVEINKKDGNVNILGVIQTPEVQPTAQAGVQQTTQPGNQGMPGGSAAIPDTPKTTPEIPKETPQAEQPSPTPLVDNANKNIRDLATKLEDFIKNFNKDNKKTDDQKVQEVQTILADIEKNIAEVKDGDLSADTIKSISDALKDTASIVNNFEKNSSLAAALKKSLLEFVQKVVEKATTITIEGKSISVSNNVLDIQIGEDSIKQQIKSVKDFINQVKDEFSEIITSDEIEAINTAITINIPKIDNVNKLYANISAGILKTAKDNGLDGIIINMNNVGFKLEADTFVSLKPDDKILVSAEVIDNTTASVPKSAHKVLNMPIMQLSVKIGDSEVKKFAKPIELTFDLSVIDTNSYNEQELKNLAIYMLNENTLDWENVGGKFDLISKKLTTYRSHLSKYTVMKVNKSFADVSNNWAKDAINLMLNKGIINETAKFEPNKNITRAEFAAWIVRLFGFDGMGMKNNFKDVAASSPYYNEISAAYSEGIINGTSTSSFSPDKNITREEMTTILCRALSKYKNNKILSDDSVINTIKEIKDMNTISTWAKDSVATMYKNGIVNGYSDKSFKAKANLTKSEAAMLIYRIFDTI